MRAWRGFCCLVLFFSLHACGDDDSGSGPPVGSGNDGGNKLDGGPDGGGGGGGGMTPNGGGSHSKDASFVEDAGADAEVFNPFVDAAVDSGGGQPPIMMMAGPPPKAWSCPATLWADGHCDCGCSATDYDCKSFSCIDPGCVEGACEACFTLSGSWKPCEPDPDMSDWSCDALAMADGLCDCGCNIPDPNCKGSGCTGPGCRKPACEVRHGCSTEMIAAKDDCSSANPHVLTDGDWTCPWDHYASGDGCDCGCGAVDPDCGIAGCTAERCFDDACVRCTDEESRPYNCDAAKAGWDDDTVGDATSNQPSMCNGIHFGSGDGCDCGCGGHDPDCGKNNGCEAPGCSDSACDRCTDVITRLQTGCLTQGNEAATWSDTNQCNPDNFGTGDGCDCGCGVADPDCAGKGCTGPGCTNAACDVCNDGAGFFVPCSGWTCGAITDPAFANAECDCGCGKTDPFCRDTHRKSCTKAGCEVTTCQFCNEAGNRTSCGGEWEGDTGGTSSTCNKEFYDLDGLCDCGCGAHDPDCEKGQDCTDKGCVAPDCDVCHDGNLLALCYQWTCDPDLFDKDGECDCGCGAVDPDCGTGGCQEPGCKDDACETCHDPLGRALPCP